MFFFAKIPSISLNEIQDYSKIIDVRTPEEFRTGHLKGVKNIPLDRLERFSSQSVVYVICATGSRSKAAVRYLRKKGMNAINIKGGMLRNG